MMSVSTDNIPSMDIICQFHPNFRTTTEAIRVLPPKILPANLVLLGAHRNQKLELQVFDITTCQLRTEFNISIGYDDVEGFAMPMAACQ